MSFTVVIPSRYGSSRLPGKPLLDIVGKPMIQRVWEQAIQSDASDVVVATDDERIQTVVEGFGARCCMTSPSHPSGTDRLEQVVTELGLAGGEIVVNVQGDEPLIPPEVINQVAASLRSHPEASMSTLCEPIETVEDLTNPNVVKVVSDESGRALYFSRAPIPWPRDAFAADPDSMPEQGRWYRHIGIYAYRAAFLQRYVTWSPAPQEVLESLEQLRALHNGEHIQVAEAVGFVPPGVDTQEDIDAMRQLLESQA
jgi:3-deoxy-manno-octulosonate cytidylyltransferase (CMP-KDO synthetase)